MTLATPLQDRIQAAAEAYKKEVLLSALPDHSLLCQNLAEELGKLLGSYQRAYEKRNANLRGAVISFREGKCVVAGEEICHASSDPAFVVYLLYQHFGKDVSFSTVDKLVSWRTTQQAMEVLKTQVDASKKVTLTISPSPLQYRLEPALQPDRQLDFEYHVDRNSARQLQYIVERYETEVLATTPGLEEVKISLSNGLQRVLSHHLFQRDSGTTEGSDIVFAEGSYKIGKGLRRPMKSALGFLLFYLLHNEGEEISKEKIREITCWGRIPENMQILRDYVSPSQVFRLKQAATHPTSYALVRK